MQEQQPKPSPAIKDSSPGSLRKSLFSGSRLKPGDVRPREARQERAATSAVEPATPVREPRREVRETESAASVTPPALSSKTEANESSAVTVVADVRPPVESRGPAATSSVPPKRKAWRPTRTTILRKRDASFTEGRQVAVRLSAASTREIDQICEAIRQASGFEDPLKDAEFVRVAVDFLLRILDVRKINLADAYEGDARLSLILGDLRVETLLMELLEREIVDLLKRE